MKSKTKQFLTHFPNAYFMLLHDSNKSAPPFNLRDNFDEKLIAKGQSEGYGVFFAFNKFNGTRQKSSCKGINAWAIDMDQQDINFKLQEKRIESSPLPPTIIVRTKNGYHLYWIAHNASIENYEEVMKRLIYYFDADPNARDITRLLRVPGYMHLKNPNEPFEIQIKNIATGTYHEDFMLKQFGEYYESEPKSFWTKLGTLPSKLALETLSGIPEMNKEKIVFGKEINGKQAIIVDGRESSCWIDHKGMIGSADGGGPTWIQWLGWYGHPKGKIAQIAKTHKLINEKNVSSESTDIITRKGCYYFTKYNTDGNTTYIKATNFIIKMTNVFINTMDKSIMREIKLINKYGKEAGPFKIKSEQLASLTEFKKFCIDKGNFIYSGPERSFVKLIEYILANSDEFKVVNLIPQIGYIPQFNIFLFENALIDKEGKIYYADENSIIWKNNEGFQCYSLSEEEPVVTIEKKDIDIYSLELDFINNICGSFGEQKFKLAISWLYANIFTHEIQKRYKMFPFLYIYGKTRAGKDVLSGWLISLFGLDSSVKESLPQMRSTVGISRKAGYYSSLPVVLDEYKNINDIIKFNGFFKNLAHKIGVTKGLISRFGTYNEKINSNFIFTAEELPEDQAILSRSIILRINPNKRNDSYYNAINEHIPSYNQIGLHWLENRGTKRAEYFSYIEKIIDTLTKEGVAKYTAEAYAIAGAGYLCITDSEDDKQDYLDMLINIAKEDNTAKNQLDLLSVFFMDLDTLSAKLEFSSNAAIMEGSYCFFWLKYFVDIWNENLKRQGREPHTYKSILDLVRELPGCIKINSPKRVHGKLRKCVVFHMEKMPEEIQIFVDNYFTNTTI